MDRAPHDPLREIERLKALASWYRGWAEVAGNPQEREGRLRLAALVDAKVAALLAADPPDKT